MVLPISIINICAESLEWASQDPQHKLNPIRRLAIYDSFRCEGEDIGSRCFQGLQIITAQHVLPIWKKTEDNNSLAESLIQLAQQVFNHEQRPENLKEELQKIWVEMDWADMSSAYPERAFAALCSAFETLRILINGFERWDDRGLGQENEEDTDDELYQWGNDSARWASIAEAGWLMDTSPSEDKNRLKFWEWWLTEAVPQAWKLAQTSF